MNNGPWKCFHCGETFTDRGSAADHFGADPTNKPGCLIKVELGGERGLLMALRQAEETIAQYMAEDSHTWKALHEMQSRHSDQLRVAEETGYARGLKDNIRAKLEIRKKGHESEEHY